MQARCLMERILHAKNGREYQSYYASVLTGLGVATLMQERPTEAEEYFDRGLVPLPSDGRGEKVGGSAKRAVGVSEQNGAFENGSKRVSEKRGIFPGEP